MLSLMLIVLEFQFMFLMHDLIDFMELMKFSVFQQLIFLMARHSGASFLLYSAYEEP